MSSRTHIEAPMQFGFGLCQVPEQQVEAPDQRNRLLHTLKGVEIFRGAMDYLTLSVPASYLIAFLIDGGVLRAKAFESIGVAGFLHSVVAPGMAMGNALFSADFAGNTFVHNGWNMMFVVVGVIALVLRYHLMKPIRGLESWLRKKCQPKQQTQQIPVTFSPPFLVPRTPGARTATTPNQAGRF